MRYHYTKSAGNPEFWVYVRNLDTNTAALFPYHWSSQSAQLTDKEYETSHVLSEEEVYYKTSANIVEALQRLPGFEDVFKRLQRRIPPKIKIIH